MKKVMVRAWEIAKGAQVRFGGKAKEYFAQALTMAWKEVKEGAANFGFAVVKKLNGSLYFVTEDVDGLISATLSVEKNPYNGKMITKRNPFGGSRVVEKSTGKNMIYYKVALGMYSIEFKAGDKVSVLDINRGALAWR
ncbi:hypothetical protein [Paenibacillus sp. P46E]|uniref:hypothetical protein n=1 Tax=Paenibacillus sp. P46E TaxID=1349436 RepID=UPI0009402F00|nr:hypothetical protein [Paenibacillus sp. P46E]OKP95411.1 hypothetical protein A3849_26370 [Paenibacillus sp. P46E]